MKTLKLLSRFSAVLLGAAFTLPAAAQATYNFSDGGNCNFPPYTCNIAGSNTVASSLTISGWAAASGANFAAANITDQSGSGVGMSYSGETSNQPQHAIDNDTQTELVMLNFGGNKVVLTGLSTGWSQNDTDIAVLRWTGASAPGPTMSSYNVANLVASGWAIVSSADLDGSSGTGATFGTLSGSTGLTVNSANSSSWWIVSSYFGGGSLNGGTADGSKDYFKLLSVSATCVSNTSGGTCNSTPPGSVPEPASLALVGLALAGAGYSRRAAKKRA